MSRLNVPPVGPSITTHEGAPAMRISALKELRRSVLTAMLWENTFYETGSEVAERIKALVKECNAGDVALLAIEARDKMYLRHVPLFLVRELARTKGNGSLVAATLAHIIQRPDELGEYLAMYWGGVTSGNKKRPEPLSAGSKRGLAAAFKKFNEYQLAKYNRDTGIKLADVLRLVHAKPERFTGTVSDMGVEAVMKEFIFNGPAFPAKNEQAGQRHRVRRDTQGQGALWGKLIAGQLETPDTWEVALSAGGKKKEVFERLLSEQKLGALAFLRNLRNMIDAGVDSQLINARFEGNFDKVLPFRFIAAARHAPRYEPQIEQAMLKSIAELPKLTGTTVLIVDVSGSMSANLSSKSEMTRLDTAAALAVLAREQCEHAIVIATAGNDYSRIHQTVELPARRGMALRDQINGALHTMGGGGIFLTQCLQASRDIIKNNVDRVIVFTDEQDCDINVTPERAQPFGKYNYVVNISTEKNGVSYGKQWTAHIDGFSEKVLDFMRAVEAESAQGE